MTVARESRVTTLLWTIASDKNEVVCTLSTIFKDFAGHDPEMWIKTVLGFIKVELGSNLFCKWLRVILDFRYISHGRVYIYLLANWLVKWERKTAVDK